MIETTDKKCCMTCKYVYWDGDLDYDNESHSAECWRYPPVWVPGIGDDSIPEYTPGWKHPRVSPVLHICGEYAPNAICKPA